MFENFPKSRIDLPERFRKIYSEHYRKNRKGQTFASFFSQKAEKWLHVKVAADVTDTREVSTLEIGAGTLNHLKYENTRPYDSVEPFKELYSDSPDIDRINTIYSDIDNISPDICYNRIISIATFEHITDLPKVVAKSCILLKNDGTLRVAIPNEGTFFWKLGWKLTTGLEFRIKYGLDYGILLQYEHVSDADEIEEVLKFFFREVRTSYSGIGKKLSFYRFFECFAPDKDLGKEYLRNRVNCGIV